MNLLDMILNYYGIVLFIIDVILIVNFGKNRILIDETKSIFYRVLIAILTIIIIYNFVTTQTIEEKIEIYQIPNTQETYLIDNVSGSGFLFFKTSEKSIVEYYDGKEIKRIKVDIEDLNILYDVKNSDHNYVLLIYKKTNGMGDKTLIKIEFHLQQREKI